MNNRLVGIKAYYRIGDETMISTRFFNLPILDSAQFDILETHIEQMEELGYTDICIMMMNDELIIVDSIKY